MKNLLTEAQEQNVSKETMLVCSEDEVFRSIKDSFKECNVIIPDYKKILDYDFDIIFIDDETCIQLYDAIVTAKNPLSGKIFKCILINSIVRQKDCPYDFVDYIITTPSENFYSEVYEQLLLNRFEKNNLSASNLLIHLARAKDDTTGLHMQRTGEYVRIISTKLFDSGKICQKDVFNYWLAAPLHDIGKIGIPDKILGKKGKLDSSEFLKMKEHTIIGSEALSIAHNHGSNEHFKVAQEIALTHHERWDGTGYPHGLRHEKIPLPGRIMAIADSFDVATNDRPYKKALPFQDAFDDIVQHAGTQFDPQLIEIMVKYKGEFKMLAESKDLPAGEK